MSKINKIRLDGTDYDIERGMLPEVAQELPQTGSEDTMYLVPSENPGTQIETVSGEFSTVQNDLPYESPLASVEMLGKAEQTTYSGKNLIENTRATGSTTLNGMTFTNNSDGTITLNGTSTALTWYVFHSEQLDLPDGTYTISLQGGTNANVSIYNDKFGITLLGSSTTRAITDASGNVSLRVASGATASNLTVKPMIESGSSMTDWEKFVGGTPAPNPSFPQPISVVTGENAVKIEGKNLFDISKVTNVTDHLWNNGNGTISITTYAGNTFVACNETFAQLCPSLKVGDVVTLSAESTGTGKLVYFLGGGGSWNFGATKTITQAMLTSKLCFYASGVNTSATISDIQFELGSTATAFEPYQGQEFEVNLGKNLFDKDNMDELGGYYIGGNGAITSGNGNYLTWVQLQPNTTYTLSQSVRTSQTTRIGLFSSPITSSSTGVVLGTFLSGATIKQTFTTTDTNRYLAWVYWNGSQPDSGTYTRDMCKSSVQIEKGSTATSYAPYFTPIELAKIGTYQDRIYKEDSKWYIEKQVGKVVLDGTEDGWGWADTARYTITTSNIGAREAISDHFTYVNYTGHATTASPSFDISSNLASIGFHDKDITSLNNFKTWLASNPTTVYYALATPTTTEITNEALIAQLDTLGASSLYLGVNNIGTETQNAVPTLVLGYDAIDPQKKYDEYVWVEDDQEFELIGQAGAIQQLQRDVAEVKGGSSVTHLIPVIEDGAVWGEWQLTKDRSYAPWRLLSCDKASFNVSGTSETMSLQEVFTALENGAEYVFDSLPLDEVDPVILGLNPPEYPEVSGVTVASRQSFSYVSGPDPATDTINVVFHSGSVESIFVPYNENPRVYKVMTGVLRQEEAGGGYKYLFMLGRVISMTPIN